MENRNTWNSYLIHLFAKHRNRVEYEVYRFPFVDGDCILCRYSLQGPLLTLLQTQQKDLPHEKPPPLCICDNKMSKDLPQVQVMVRSDSYVS